MSYHRTVSVLDFGIESSFLFAFSRLGLPV